MKQTWQEWKKDVHISRCIRRGRKHKWLRPLMLLETILIILIKCTAEYLKQNKKRLVGAGMTVLFFLTYANFSSLAFLHQPRVDTVKAEEAQWTGEADMVQRQDVNVPDGPDQMEGPWLDGATELDKPESPVETNSQVDSNNPAEANGQAGSGSPAEANSEVGSGSPAEANSEVGSNNPIEANSQAEANSPVEINSPVETDSLVETDSPAETNSLVETDSLMEEAQDDHSGSDAQYSADEILGGKASREWMNQSVDKAKTVNFSKDDWNLILVNKQHPVPEGYTFEMGVITADMKCDARILPELFAMLQAAKEDGVNLKVCSPYRDISLQNVLFERKIKLYMGQGDNYMEAYKKASQIVTVPGASEHQVGLALDIICDTYTSLDEGFGKTAAGKWLKEHGKEFGFILRYPKGKEHITGIGYEPWHFRYVGKEAATIIMDNDLTLEEFVESISE